MDKYKIEVKWSLIFAITYFLWLLIEKYLGFHSQKALQEPLFNLIFAFILLILYFFALKNKKEVVFNNQISWKESFASGLILSLLATVTTTFVVYVVFTYVSPHYFETAISLSKNKEFAEYNYNLPTFIKNNIFDKLSFGVVFTACISFFIKTK